MKTFLSGLLLVAVLFASCKQPGALPKQSSGVEFFDPAELGAINKSSNICMEVRFSDCGEWGGHREKITVFADSSRNVHVRYQVYPFNCDSLPYYYRNKELIPVLDKTTIIDDEEKQVLTNYIHALAQAKITEGSIDKASNAADVYTLANDDSTFFIQLISNRESDERRYKGFVDSLFN